MNIGVVGSGFVGATTAYVIGERGDSEVLTWSLTAIGGTLLDKFARLRQLDLTDSVRQDIDRKVGQAAYTIISGKGATYYGIGSALSRIVDAILHDQRSILTVRAPTEEVNGVADITVALPRLVGGAGVLETFPLPLDERKAGLLHRSAQVVKDSLRELETAA